MEKNTPNNPTEFQTGVNTDRTPRREGGEDSVENMRPDDSRADEKVVSNVHGGRTSFQTVADNNENSAADDGA